MCTARQKRSAMRASALAAAAAFLVVGTASCTKSSSAPTTSSSAQAANVSADNKGITIDFVSGPLNDSFFPPLYNGVKDAAANLGVKVNYIAINEGNLVPSSVQTMQAAIAEHPSAIVVGDFVTSSVDPLIKQAIAAGIPVYVDQSGQESWAKDGAFGFVGQQGGAAGNAAAQQMISAGAKNVLCVIHNAGNPYLNQVCNGFIATMKAAGGTVSELNFPISDSTNPQKVTSDIGAYLASHHGIQGVFTLNAAVGTDAVAALAQANLTGKVKVGTLELSKVAINDVQNGTMLFLVNEQPYLDGYYGVLFAYQFVKYGLAPVGTVNTGPSIIDKSNIQKVIETTQRYPDVLGSS
jgi:simple sugar transport system substrate-binding protein